MVCEDLDLFPTARFPVDSANGFMLANQGQGVPAISEVVNSANSKILPLTALEGDTIATKSLLK
jgi:hypothetical protein